jgi:hypothetical protein
VLETGPEAIRDGDWSNMAEEITSAGGAKEIQAIITFPETSIAYVNYRIVGLSLLYDGDAVATLDVSLKEDLAWVSIYSWTGHGGATNDTGWVTNDNGAAGWDNITGMRLFGRVSSTEMSTAVVRFYEMAAFTPEPATLSMLAIGAIWMVVRRRR